MQFPSKPPITNLLATQHPGPPNFKGNGKIPEIWWKSGTINPKVTLMAIDMDLQRGTHIRGFLVVWGAGTGWADYGVDPTCLGIS